MSDTLNTILLILFVIRGLFISLKISGWRMKKAFDPASTVELPYEKCSLFNFSLRDYRPQALQELVKQGVVQIQEEGQYFLH